MTAGRLSDVDVDAHAADFAGRFDPEPWLQDDRDSWLIVEPFIAESKPNWFAMRASSDGGDFAKRHAAWIPPANSAVFEPSPHRRGASPRTTIRTPSGTSIANSSAAPRRPRATGS